MLGSSEDFGVPGNISGREPEPAGRAHVWKKPCAQGTPEEMIKIYRDRGRSGGSRRASRHLSIVPSLVDGWISHGKECSNPY